MGVLLTLFEGKCLGRLVADLCRTPVLDRTRIDVSGLTSPLVAMCGKLLEGGTVELDKGLADHCSAGAVVFFTIAM